MSNFEYFLVSNPERVSITVISDGAMFNANNESHPNISEIIQAAIAGDESVTELFDVATGINHRFERLTDRISVRGDTILLDNDPAPKAISDAILTHYEAGTNPEALVNFLEKLANNPNQDSVEQLYPWLEATDGFTITEDGDLIAYKGVANNDAGDGYQSVNHGRAIVNGEIVEGAIPNGVGDVIEMPRSEVTFDPRTGCAQGLHAGTYEYAEGWARGGLLEVLIDPRDVVSVPHCSSAQKLRVCRYTVLDVIEEKDTAPVKGFVPEEPDHLAWGDFEVEVEYEVDEHPYGVGDEVVSKANGLTYEVTDVDGEGNVQVSNLGVHFDTWYGPNTFR